MAPGGIRVLNVAEKPSVAREITSQLGGGGVSRRNSHGVPVTEFPYTLRQTQCRMVVTAVRGHLLETQFPPEYSVWKAHNPSILFQVPVQRKAPADNKNLELMLTDLARQCQWLVLWLDCDREGEAIAFEVLETCQRAAGGRLQVFRAVFSALTRQDLVRACQTLRDPDQRLADAVEARQHFDLRAGSAFTRWMSLRYQNMFPELCQQPLSYGPCQFPTLGFVVERFLRIQRFVSEPFWSIKAEVQKDGHSVRFNWRRGRLFDRLAVLTLYELVVEEAPRGALVTRIAEEPKSRWRPLPLNTVQMTKLATSKLHMASARCMQVAEELYQGGFISYPRTETDRFQKTIDVFGLVQTQVPSSAWGNFARSLVDGRFTEPRAGSNDDHAHPPIHPVRCGERGQFNDESWRVYELITRHFLACCAPDARGNRTEVEISIAEEEFATSGDIVLDRGWLDVYPYSNWVNDPLPPFRNHEVVAFSLLEMAESRTQAPPLLSEADLISLMDREKIGTDATMHDHIQKIQTRTYAVKNADGRLEPSRLGLALVQGYQRFAAEEGMDLSKPILRARMERGMEAVAAGRQRKEDFLREALDIAQRCYAALERNAPALDQTLGQHFSSQLDVGRRAQVVQAAFSMCRCGASMELRRHIPGGPPGGGGAVGRGRARGRGRAGRAGRGRGRGRAMVRGRGPVQRGRAAVARQELFLVCPNGACGVVLRLSLRSDQTPTAYGHMCPICDFQVLNIKNEETQRNHQLVCIQVADLQQDVELQLELEVLLRLLQSSLRLFELECRLMVVMKGSDRSAQEKIFLPEQLIEAGADGDYEFIRLCVEAGVPLDIFNERGVTPLISATVNNKVASARLLLESGADPSMQDINGATCAHYAIELRRFQILDAALEAMSRRRSWVAIYIKDARGYNVLDYARLPDHDESLRLLKLRLGGPLGFVWAVTESMVHNAMVKMPKGEQNKRGLAKHVAKLAAERAAAKVKEKIQQTKEKAREKLLGGWLCSYCSEAKISEKKLSETIHMDMPDSDEDDEDVSEGNPAAMAGMHGVAIGSGIEPRWKHDEVFIGKMEKGESIEITTCSEDTTKEQREILQERQLISNPLKACLRSCVDSLNGVVDDSATPKAKPRRPRREQTMLDKMSKIVTILQWVPELTFHKVRADLVAGLTVGVMVIPQSMSYGAIAGLPYINGMYSACVPTLVYALFGQSRQLAVGPVAMVSLLIEAGLNGSLGPECNVPGKAQYEVCTSEYVGLACLAAALVGAMQVVASILKLGFLVTFLGHPVISGFTSGAAIIIGLSQLKYMLGYDIPKSQYIYDTIINVAMNIQETKPMPLLLGVLWLAYLISNKQIAGRYRRLKMLAPMGPLISCVAGTVLIWAWPDMSEKYHVKYVGEIPSGLFPISIGSWQLDKIPTVVGTAMSACLIGYMESIAIGKNLAATNGYEIEACFLRAPVLDMCGVLVLDLWPKLFFFYDRNFLPLRDQMVASLEQSGGLADFTLCEDVLDDLKGNNRAGGGMPTYLYKSAKIGKALNEVDADEIFLFTDVDVQYFQPVHEIVRECMADGTDIVFQQDPPHEFEDIGVNIGFMAMRKSAACHAFWEFVHAEISRTLALDQRVVNNSLYSGHAAETFGLRWKRWPSSIWASSMAFSGPLPQPLVVHHANFLIEKAPAADPSSKVAQLTQLRQATLGDDKEAQAAWAEFMQGARTCPAMLDYRSRHFGERRPGPEWSTLPENHIARLGGYSERAAKRAAAAVKGAPGDPDAARTA
eukprot:s121_g42.t2